ncbi:Hydrogen peroxide-inducible genes activator [Marinobacter litoralis]|uniref:Hydrogen peroxide-inducible genes activator n=1 Tax=Marinobacter litoralis TaxID=187981 RepID=A0A3M2RGP0_9GAMM|nr:LysR substrate-binding domain-containing protein [Marinobacter litoralis]RMJ04483.1 Hydrogen peroxide-inducible genes activator [Marinobacter litoralis]
MLPELKIQQLRYVITVVDEGGFNAAAKRVHRTQPALSMAVRELEQRLGQDIFERGGKSQLTPFGQFCLPRFRELLGQHDRVVKDVVGQADGRQGHVHIATVPSVASRIMPPLLADFIERFPDLTISLHDENAHYVCQMVAQGEVDLGITSLWQSDDDLDYTHLFEDKVGVVCHRSHPLASRSSIDWQSLQGEKLIRNGTSRLLMGTEASELVENSAFYISNMISLIAMLEAGAGVTTLPQLAFPEHNANLCFIPLQEPDVVRRIGLVKASNRTLAPAAQIMEGFLLERLKDEPE